MFIIRFHKLQFRNIKFFIIFKFNCISGKAARV